MTRQDYSFQATLAESQRIQWRVEDLIGGERQLDFSLPFLPDSLSRSEALAFLTPAQRRQVNQIRAHSYLCTFGLIEEFILPFVLDHARPDLYSDDFRVRALLQFAGEEAKHIHLFKRFRQAFDDGFGSACGFIGATDALVGGILSRHPLAVALAVLHIEWMTERHYCESVRAESGIDPVFRNMLKHHWLEEAQHAKLDTLMIRTLAANCGSEEIAGAVDEYLGIVAMLDEALRRQVPLELEAFVRAGNRQPNEAEQARYLAVQERAMRWTFLGAGMTHGSFLETVGQVAPDGRRRIEAAAPAYC